MESSIAIVMVLWISPSKSESSKPVTVIVCGVLQLVGLKVSVWEETEPSVSSETDRLKTTSEVISLSKTTVKVSVVPDSETSILFLDTVTPGVTSGQSSFTGLVTPFNLPSRSSILNITSLVAKSSFVSWS